MILLRIRWPWPVARRPWTACVASLFGAEPPPVRQVALSAGDRILAEGSMTGTTWTPPLRLSVLGAWLMVVTALASKSSSMTGEASWIGACGKQAQVAC